MKFQVTGNCVVHATVSAEIEADSKEEAEQKMLAMFNADNKSMCVDPALETACDLEAIEALPVFVCADCGETFHEIPKTVCHGCGKPMCEWCSIGEGKQLCWDCEDGSERLPDGCR